MPASPPEAITGIETSRANAAVASRLRPVKKTVPRNVGIDDRRDAGILEPPRQLGCGQLAGFRPALDRDAAVTRIDADRDLPRKRGRGFAHELRVANSHSAQNDTSDTFIQPVFDLRQRSDAAAELHRN